MHVEVYIFLLSNFQIFYFLLDPKDSSQKPAFMIIFCIFDYTPCKINSINSITLCFKAPKLEGKQLPQQLFFELDNFLQSVRTFILEHALGHPLAGVIVSIFAGIELT